MTPAEFKERFNVWDVVKSTEFTSIKIKFIGEDKFFGKGLLNLSKDNAYEFHHDWVKVEPEKKPSEEIFKNIHPAMDTGVIAREIIRWLDENWPKVAKK